MCLCSNWLFPVLWFLNIPHQMWNAATFWSFLRSEKVTERFSPHVTKRKKLGVMRVSNYKTKEITSSSLNEYFPATYQYKNSKYSSTSSKLRLWKHMNHHRFASPLTALCHITVVYPSVIWEAQAKRCIVGGLLKCKDLTLTTFCSTAGISRGMRERWTNELWNRNKKWCIANDFTRKPWITRFHQDLRHVRAARRQKRLGVNVCDVWTCVLNDAI